jgi:hypothetical protein
MASAAAKGHAAIITAYMLDAAHDPAKNSTKPRPQPSSA